MPIRAVHTVFAAAIYVALSPLTGCGVRDPNDVPGLRRLFGRTGMGPGEFSYPRAGARSPDGRLYIVDKAARIQCYSPAGEFVLDWHMPEWSAGKPTGLTVAPDGRVFVADTHYARVKIFDPNGAPLATFGTFGHGPGQFILPTDVAVDAAGDIFVSEYGGNDRISKFTSTFEFVTSFGGPDAGDARTQRPQSLLIDHDALWVADACNHRICRFTLDGTLQASFGHEGSGLGELRFPYSVDRLSDGSLVVAEFGNNRIQRFDTDGRSLGVWGEAGRHAGQLAYPWAAIAGADDSIYVIDSGNNRVQIVDGGRIAWRTQ